MVKTLDFPTKKGKPAYVEMCYEMIAYCIIEGHYCNLHEKLYELDMLGHVL